MTRMRFSAVAAIAAVLGLGVSLPLVASAAQDAAVTNTAPPPPDGHRGWGDHGGPHAWGPAHLYRKLGLTAEQQASVQSIMQAARPGFESLHEQMRANDGKLRATTPDDPNYASIASEVGQTRGTLTTQLAAQEADLRAKLYAVLTPAQKTQLATLEAQRHDGPGHDGPAPTP
jgi:Spy/CpxP family protein refolding chaperone